MSEKSERGGGVAVIDVVYIRSTALRVTRSLALHAHKLARQHIPILAGKILE